MFDADAHTQHIRQLVAKEQVRLALEQLRRIPPLLFAVDLACCLIIWLSSGEMRVWVWLALMTVAVQIRTEWLLRLDRGGQTSANRMLTNMTVSLAAQGAFHSLIIVLAAVQPDVAVHYAISVIMLGVAAGAVTPAAGYTPIYAWWAVVFGAVLGGAWVAEGSTQGYLFAALLIALMFLFVTYVKDQGKTLGKLVVLAESARQSRDQAQTQKALAQEAHRQAEAANVARTHFFAAASHDLRQPLHALSLNAATVQVLADQRADDALHAVGKMIQRSLTECRTLVDALLEISELDAGAVKPSIKPVSVSDWLAHVRLQFEPLVLAKGLSFAFINPPDNGLDTQVWVASTDTVLAQRILTNLLSNAIKFTEKGGIALSFFLDVHSTQWRIHVRDTGQGIPEAEQERIFEEFYQIGNPQRDRSRGLGLGLSIVKRLSDLIGARVCLLESSALGSTFELSVPAICSHEPLAHVAHDAHQQANAGLLGSAYRILVVDDEADVRDSLSLFFIALGWQPQCVSDGAGAIALLDQGWQPNGMVIDYRLQADINGLDVWHKLTRMGCHAPAVLVTGDTSPDRILAAKSAGLPVLYKPIDGMELARLIHDLIEAPVQHGSAQGPSSGPPVG